MTGCVVVGIDGSASANAAVEWAADDAARTNAALRIVHVREPLANEYPMRAVGIDESLTTHGQNVLAAAAELARARAPGIEVITNLITGAVIERLASAAPGCARSTPGRCPASRHPSARTPTS
ncbi:universal stress protein [Planotetraspora sp. GP83]|uniref:universal stress protein n=1 Tax=Planotetraspora sp. GP83 TaxID=3156264 RepID=UPI00351884E3